MATKKPQAPAKAATPKQQPAVGVDPRGALPEHDPRRGVREPTKEDDEDLVRPRGQKRVVEIEDEQVTVQVPQAFRLSHGKGETHYEPGIYEMPRSHAEHWYSKHFGVEIK